MNIERDGYLASNDKTRLDVGRVHGWIASTYWARNIPLDVMRKAIDGSLCYGIYLGQAQVAFARVVTDGATFAYLCDVYVDEAHRRRGLSEWLLSAIHAEPELQGLRRWMLATRDAHPLYARLGWTPVSDAKPFMQRHDPEIYMRDSGD